MYLYTYVWNVSSYYKRHLCCVLDLGVVVTQENRTQQWWEQDAFYRKIFDKSRTSIRTALKITFETSEIWSHMCSNNTGSAVFSIIDIKAGRQVQWLTCTHFSCSTPSQSNLPDLSQTNTYHVNNTHTGHRGYYIRQLK